MARFVDHAVRPEDSARFARLLPTGPKSSPPTTRRSTDPARASQSAPAATTGLIEAIYLSQSQFALGVQWHPEVTDDTERFTALVEAAAHATNEHQAR